MSNTRAYPKVSYDKMELNYDTPYGLSATKKQGERFLTNTALKKGDCSAIQSTGESPQNTPLQGKLNA